MGTWWNGLDPQDLYAQNHPPGTKLVWSWNAAEGSSVPDNAYCQKFYNRTLDLINKYHPDVLYFDDTVLPLYPISDVGLKIAAHFYNSNALWHNGDNQGVLLGKILQGDEKKCMVWDVERGASPTIEDHPWQSETCIGVWHYDRSLYNKNGYKSSATVIHTLADVVSKNGVFLLNVPVRADGTIDEKEIAVVQSIGKWLKTNGESIYDTRPWRVCGEGPSVEHPPAIQAQGFNEAKISLTEDDKRFTTKGDSTIYVIVLGCPTKPVLVKSFSKQAGLLDRRIKAVQLLGSSETVKWAIGDNGVTIQPPITKPFDEAIVFKVSLEK